MEKPIWKITRQFYEYITSKVFDLERGQPKEVTGKDYLTPENYKKATNYYETKKYNIRITRYSRYKRI